MSRITHFTNQAKTILYWDYYILCHLDTEAAMILQQLEYWDGVKNKGNIVNRDINDERVENGKEATQDTEQFVYKSQDELKWELMGLVGNNNLGIKLKMLTTSLPYVISRNNPLNPTDRKKQYHLAKGYVQVRIDHLAKIIATFQEVGCRMNAIYYAIEDLTKGHVHVEDLDNTQVVKKLVELCQQAEIDDVLAIEDREQQKKSPKGTKKPTPYEPVVPKFLRIQLKTDKQLIENINLSSNFPNFKFKEWEPLKIKNGLPKNKESIPQNQGISSNYVSSNYNQQLQNSKCVSPASESPTETMSHTPKQSSVNPLETQIPETPMPESIIVPELPLEEWPWDAKKALKLTEILVNTKYSNYGKTLKACQEILNTYDPTEGEYKRVVEKASAWYQENGQKLHPASLLNENKKGNIWFYELFEEVKRSGMAHTSKCSQSQEAEPYKESPARTTEQLPDEYIKAIVSMGNDTGCSEYCSTSEQSIFSVYQQTMWQGMSLETFEQAFIKHFTQIGKLTLKEVHESRHEDHLDYLCRAMQAELAAWSQLALHIVESDVAQH